MFTFLHQTDKFIITEIRPLKHFDSEVTILNPKTILPHLTVRYRYHGYDVIGLQSFYLRRHDHRYWKTVVFIFRCGDKRGTSWFQSIAFFIWSFPITFLWTTVHERYLQLLVPQIRTLCMGLLLLGTVW